MNAAIITIDYYIQTLGVMESKYPGKFCQGVKEKLLSSHPLLTVKQNKITNGLVVELVRLRNARRLPWKMAVLWLKQLCGRNWPTNEPSELTLIKKFIESIVIWY